MRYRQIDLDRFIASNIHLSTSSGPSPLDDSDLVDETDMSDDIDQIDETASPDTPDESDTLDD